MLSLITCFRIRIVGFEGGSEELVLSLNTAAKEKLTHKAIYFIRSNPKGVRLETVEQDVCFGETTDNPMAAFDTMMHVVFLHVRCFKGEMMSHSAHPQVFWPTLNTLHASEWGEIPSDDRIELLDGMEKV